MACGGRGVEGSGMVRGKLGREPLTMSAAFVFGGVSFNLATWLCIIKCPLRSSVCMCVCGCVGEELSFSFNRERGLEVRAAEPNFSLCEIVEEWQQSVQFQFCKFRSMDDLMAEWHCYEETFNSSLPFSFFVLCLYLFLSVYMSLSLLQARINPS